MLQDFNLKTVFYVPFFITYLIDFLTAWFLHVQLSLVSNASTHPFFVFCFVQLSCLLYAS